MPAPERPAPDSNLLLADGRSLLLAAARSLLLAAARSLRFADGRSLRLVDAIPDRCAAKMLAALVAETPRASPIAARARKTSASRRSLPCAPKPKALAARTSAARADNLYGICPKNAFTTDAHEAPRVHEALNVET